MTAKKHEGTGLDDLMRKALAGELPADVETGMRRRIERFRAGMIDDERRTAARARLFPRSAWAVLAVLLLAAGILLQGLGSRNALAEKIAQIKAEAGDSRLGPIGRRAGEAGIPAAAPFIDRVHVPSEKEAMT